jgi:hypothetical protein
MSCLAPWFTPGNYLVIDWRSIKFPDWHESCLRTIRHADNVTGMAMYEFYNLLSIVQKEDINNGPEYDLEADAD